MKHIIFNENMLIAFFFEVCQGQLYVRVRRQQIKETESCLIIVLGITQKEIFKKLIRNYDMKQLNIGYEPYHFENFKSLHLCK